MNEENNKPTNQPDEGISVFDLIMASAGIAMSAVLVVLMIAQEVVK